VQKQIAVWNTDLKLWIKPNEVLFSEHLELFSATWPTSGMTQGGVAYELPKQVPHTNASESLLLRSPKASEGQGGALGEAEAKRRGNTVGVRDQVMDLVASQGVKVSRAIVNLPTPLSSDYKSPKSSPGYGPNLPEVAKNLLPTPNTMEHREVKTPEQIAALKAKSPGGYRNLRETVINELPMFPTPVASEGTKAPSQQTSATKSKTGQVWLSNVAKDLEPLLGTPRANAAGSSSKQVALGAPKSRIEDQVKLFPTLRASDGYERRNQKTMDRIARDGGDMTMTTLARTTTDWGKFEPAIRRWETILGRPAPEPTKPDGKDNNHRLSSKFTEWMMGLPDGWITGHDLKRNDELKLAGNGVVPQQAELALRLLLELPEIREN
jgi:hypothetical protein